MPIIFIQLSAVLCIATLVSWLMKRLEQPLMVGYILTGIIIGPALLGLVHQSDAIETFGKIGVAFLLFLVGLRLKPKMIREVGMIALLTGLGQIAVTASLGFLLAQSLGFSFIPALYVAIAFTFSSTIVILQLLYTKEEQDTLYGRIATGFMLVQDIVAMVLLLLLSSTVKNGSMSLFIALVFVKAFVIIFSVYLLTVYLIPKIDRFFAESRQVLFLFALSVCFLFATIFSILGFSFELGAFLAGVLLSVSPYHRDIASRISTLQDFFLVMFFIVLGTQVIPATLVGNWTWIILFSLFILIADPLVVILIMRPFGYTLRTSFYTGLTAAQISEFSLVLLATGVNLGHIPENIFGPATMVALITIFASSYMIMNNERIYNFFERPLKFIFGVDATCEIPQVLRKADTILFGCHRLGSGIVDALETMQTDFFVVDHNPETIKILSQGKIKSIFGSADDVAFLASLPIKNARLIISTVPEGQVNLTLVNFVRQINKDAVVICVSYHESQAEELYVAGATYVVIPPYLGKRYLIDLLKTHQFDDSSYRRERLKHRKDLKYLKEML
ncbi:MAG: cation:proton antiporter [Patescibacteria group bacterium]|jgi:Kef-type K+ transport system membrane component KefB